MGRASSLPPSDTVRLQDRAQKERDGREGALNFSSLASAASAAIPPFPISDPAWWGMSTAAAQLFPVGGLRSSHTEGEE